MGEDKEILKIQDNKKQLLKKIIDKSIYFLEFILSVIFMIYYYKLITVKAYNGYYSKIYLTICGIIGIGIFAIIVYTFIKNKTKIEKIFLAIAIPIGMAYLIFLVPTYAPDENAHIYRSYDISYGNIISKVDENGYVKTDIPSVFINNNHHTLKKYSELNKSINEKTDYNDIEEINNPAASYFFTLYFPNTLMFLLGRMFDINGLIVIYLARIVNFIIFLICGYYSIKIIPFGKILMMTYLLIPMSIHQAISLSADSLTNSVAILFIAYTLYLYFKENIIKKHKIIYAILAILTAVQKTAYLPLIFISLMFISKKNMDKKDKTKIILITILIAILIALAWVVLKSGGSNEPDDYLIQNNVNSVEQIKYILRNPIRYIKVLYDTLTSNIENYYLWFMGFSMGWMDIGVSRVFLDLFFILLIFSPFVEKNHNKELNWKDKLLFLMIFMIVFVLTLTAMYIGHTGVGDHVIKGVQGRYFIPVAILLLLCLCGEERYIRIKHIQYIYPVLITLLNIKVVDCIITFFI
ncbi:MAG: DUF2142 domain-containing protein [Clostridia bacterium]|nr:DUF2142 domain-containing protein [Clostridia bacterium]